MIAMLNVGRFLMLGWVAYSLLLIFSPGLLHQAPNQLSGIVQAIAAFAIGHLLDRLLGVVRRRKALAET
jgi:hypothetical protein